MDGNSTWTDAIPDECIRELATDYFCSVLAHLEGGLQQHHCWIEGIVYTSLEDWIDEEDDDQ